MSEYQMQARGWKVSQSPKVVRRKWINKRTGEISMVPEGIDPGWDYNPGKAREENQNKFMAGKLKSADPNLAAVAKKDLVDYAARTK